MAKNSILKLLGGAAAVVAIGGGAGIALAQAQGGPVTYWMTAETSSGLPSFGGRGADPQAMMRSMMGGGQSSYSHNLLLQLGSGRRPSGAPSAEHIPPSGLGAGQSLPLVTPAGSAPTSWAGKIERPRGRILVYWGCGDHARAGQPAVIDFASLSAGKMPPAFASINTSSGPAPGKNATYGEWPNQRSEARVPASGSLVGEHVVRGNYTPDIRFTLGSGQDFLPPVSVSGNEAGAGGAIPLSWRPIASARGWFASTMGAAPNGDVVMWSSSESQAMPMMMSQVSPDEIARLVQQRVVMGPQASRCTIPAEVARAAPEAMLSLTAFGPEANFSHPARPAKAPAGWRPDWTVKLLTKSTYTGMLGMDIQAMMRGAMGGGGDGGDEE